MEYADGGNFVDEKNRFAINRNALSSNVKVEYKCAHSIITALKMRLEYVV